MAGLFSLLLSLIVFAQLFGQEGEIKEPQKTHEFQRQGVKGNQKGLKDVVKRTVFALFAAGCMLAGSTDVNAQKAALLSEPPIPDWTTWKCENPLISHEIIETYECYGPEVHQKSCVILKIKGERVPFLIGWGYNERATNPIKKAYVALYKDGTWVVGARGTGFTTEESSNSISFYIFLNRNYSVREQTEIRLPEAKEVKV